MRRMCKFSAIIYEKYHKSLCIMEASTCWLQTFFSSRRLRKKIVFVEMLCLRTSGEMGRHGDGFSIRKDFYQFWLRSQKREKETQEQARGRVSGESSGWVYQRKTKPNEFFSPVVCCLRAVPVVVWGGQ